MARARARAHDHDLVLELKVARGKKTLAAALAEGVEQARSKGYARELVAAGAAPVHGFVLAFAGKELRLARFEVG